MAAEMEFWFELARTYSYPAAMRVEQVAQAAGVAVHWRPFLLGPIFQAQGWNDSPFNIYPVKGQYMWRDLERICSAIDLQLRRPSQFPRGSLLAARLACWFEDESWLPEFVRRVYTANFAHDQNIADAAVIESVLASLAQPASLLAVADSTACKAKLRAQTERAQQLGIFGAPSFTVDRELFWGNDRLEAAVAWARHHAGQA
jgi:2-hydroxychromene-2-carboxylate isomerase